MWNAQHQAFVLATKSRSITTFLLFSTDISMCVENNGGCSADADCAYAYGNVTCTCKTGFTGNGYTCAGNVLL